MDEEKIKEEINQLEAEMSSIDFWQDKVRAQLVIKKISELKNSLLGSKKYDKGNCILSILSGAGGDDAEDFSAMLFKMYTKYFNKVGFSYSVISENKNSLGGYRNISIEVVGKNAYGTLKNESGVHRLIRQSPFNAKSLRQTSFSLVEVIPEFEKDDKEIEISDDDLKIEYSKSGGPGGQNVNKRETAVRVIHLPTNTSIHVTSERSQEQNKEKALEMLKGKLYLIREKEKQRQKDGFAISKTVDIEWGNQIRTYTLHPYKMIKDHRTGVEIHNTDDVLLDGELSLFIEAERDL
ncbi:MAG TPA: PCRF domain-containing protein [Candidatus Paceibacterota bacterium]|nr:PCRF domain-containing protein [Candidatus Paceibacterota bacterium]HQO70717.1 PCRF domain-containing protein [Candidatus Paceibacterota bacterium]HQQ22049.1 PCRF domain-containing protein [Candidatus Paceibacterota bacterium]